MEGNKEGEGREEEGERVQEKRPQSGENGPLATCHSPLPQ